MTEATGSPSSQQGSKSPAPWDQVWNTVTTEFNNTTDAVKSATDPSKGLPWERQWNSTTPPEKPPVAPPSVNLEGGWDSINKSYQATQGDRDKSQLAILSAELNKEKDPKNRQILMREIASVPPDFPGMIEQGNIDLAHRPIVHNADGSISTIRSLGVNINGQEVLIPTVSPDGKILTNDQAVELYKRTGQHLGKFNNPESSDIYAQKLHLEQEKMYVKRK